jgi:hypothetical protein
MMRILCRRYIIFTLLTTFIGLEQNGFSSDNDESKRKWGTAIENQAISIITNETNYAPGDTIILNIVFKNVGNMDIKTVNRHPLAMYNITVLLPKGVLLQRDNTIKEIKESPLTLYGQRMNDNLNAINMRSIIILEPGDQICDNLELSRIYDFTLEGKYTIIVNKEIWKRDNEKEFTTVISNKLEITIDNQKERK